MCEFGLEKIRAAIPRLITAAREARRVSLQANQIAIHGLEKAVAFLRAQDWRATTRTRSVQAAAVLLGCVVVFGLAAGRRSQANESAASFAAPALQTLQPPNPKNGFSSAGAAPAASPAGVSTNHVDLSQHPGVAAAPLSDETSNEVPASSGISATSKNKVKGQSGAHSSTSSTHAAKSAQRPTRPSPTESLKPAMRKLRLDPPRHAGRAGQRHSCERATGAGGARDYSRGAECYSEAR